MAKKYQLPAKYLKNIERKDSRNGGYKANIISGIIWDDDKGEDIMVTFYRDGDEWGTEVYSGENYIRTSFTRSYSRNYKKWKGMPFKYQSVAEKLREIHEGNYGYLNR